MSLARKGESAFVLEIMSYQTQLSIDEIHDYAKIGEILTDPKIVNLQLQKLELALINDALCKGILFNKTLKSILFDRSEKTNFKILPDVLKQWAIQNNFESTFAKFVRFLHTDAFQSVLKQGMFFKDLGVPQKHGIWSHCLQWYIIIEAHKDFNLFISDPYQLYKTLGDKRSNGVVDGRPIPLWNVICDRGSSNQSHDFRSPDHLHAYVKAHQDQFPLLYALTAKHYLNVKALDPDYPSVVFRDHRAINIIKK